MKLSKNSLTLLIFTFILSITLVACGTGTEDKEETGSTDPETTDQETTVEGPSGDLIIANGSDAVSLDPHGSNDVPSSNIATNIYDSLLFHDENLELQPALALSYEALDELTWEFTLREGVKFHDDSDFNAEVVKANIERILDPEVASPRSFLYNMITEVVVVNDMTVQFVTEFPFAPLPAHLAHTGGGMISLDAIEADYAAMAEGKNPGSYVGENPIGTGMFKFESWTPGQRVVLINNENYWGEQAKLNSVTFEVVPEDLTRVGQVTTGDAHVIFPLSPSDTSRVEGTNGSHVYETNSLSLGYIGFNMNKAPYDDVRVRQAISMAIDKDMIINGVLDGAAIPARSPISPDVFGFSADVDPLEFDVEAAKALLTEAGYPDGFETTIWTNDNKTRMDTAVVVQEQLKQIGVAAEIEVIEWGTYLDNTATGQHDMFILGWVTVTADADYGLYALFHSKNQGSAGNRSFMDSERLDIILDSARQESDPAVREALYKEAQEILVEEAPMIYTHHQVYQVGVRDEVEGFWKHPNGLFQLANVTLK